MPIEFACQVCKQMIRVPDGSAGRRTKCPNCSAIQPIPGGASTGDHAYSDVGTPANPFAESTASSSQPGGDANPYASPYAASGVARTASLGFEEAKQKLAVPATVCMALVTIVLVLVLLFGALFGVMMAFANPREQPSLAVNVVFCAVAFFFSVITLVTLYKGSQMQSYAMAWAGFILAAIPCSTGGCCIFVLPFAIWGMVVLSDAEVQRQFQG